MQESKKYSNQGRYAAPGDISHHHLFTRSHLANVCELASYQDIIDYQLRDLDHEYKVIYM